MVGNTLGCNLMHDNGIPIQRPARIEQPDNPRHHGFPNAHLRAALPAAHDVMRSAIQPTVKRETSCPVIAQNRVGHTRINACREGIRPGAAWVAQAVLVEARITLL